MPTAALDASLPVRCRPDCRFFSSYTTTCDYALVMFHTRGCPRDACLRYVPRAGTEPPTKITFEPEDGFFYHAAHEKTAAPLRTEENELMYTPEPPLSPPEDDRYLTAGCGHEVYDGEEVFEWEDGQTLCADCLTDRFDELTLAERAELLGCEHRLVSFLKKSALADGFFDPFS